MPHRQEPAPLPLLYQETKSLSLLHSILRRDIAQRELHYLPLNKKTFCLTDWGGCLCVYVYTYSYACGCACTGVCYAYVCSCTWWPILGACYLPKSVFTLLSEAWPLTKPEGQGFGESGSPACLEEFLSLPPEGCGQLGHHAHSCTKHVWVPEIQTPILMPAHMYLQSHLSNSVTD